MSFACDAESDSDDDSTSDAGSESDVDSDSVAIATIPEEDSICESLSDHSEEAEDSTSDEEESEEEWIPAISKIQLYAECQRRPV